MITFKKKWMSILAAAMAFVVCSICGVVFSLNANKASAAETTYDYEVYEELYTSDFMSNGTALTDGVFTIENGKFLNFTPSAENTTASFVWSFTYTATNTTKAVNIYPLASGSWGGARAFDLYNLPTPLVEGETYDVEFGVIKIKNSTKYHVFLKVDGEMRFSDADNYVLAHGGGCTCTGDDYSKHTGIYFYVTNGGSGTCSSVRPAVVVDELTNSDWKIGNQNNEVVPTEWATPTDSSKYIYFTPSEGNVSASFIWAFDYRCTTVGGGVNIYPFAGATWPQGVPYIDIGGYFSEVNKVYKVEIGVVSTDARLNENYRVYVTVDGVSKYDQVLSASLKNGTSCGDGLFVYVNGDGRGVLIGEEEVVEVEYETYDVLTNSDWGLEQNWKVANQTFINFTPSAENTTGSFIWEFDYTVTTIAGQVNMYPLASGSWGSNRAFNFNDTVFGFAAGNTYAVEFGVLKIKNSDNYRVFVNVDGVEKYNETDFVPTHNPKGCPCGGSDVSKHTGIYFYLTDATHDATFVGEEKVIPPVDLSAYVTTYDEVYNQNFTEVRHFGTAWADAGAMTDSFTMATDKNYYTLRFTPSAENTTGSFIWKYKYTHDNAGRFILYSLTNRNDRNNTYIDYASCGFVVGQTYDVELCVLKKLDSEEYDMFVVVDGVKTVSATFAASLKKGNDLFIDRANGGNGTFVSTYVAPEIEYENYDVLDNADWGLEQNWKVANQTFINFTPSAENTTASFIWKFDYSVTKIAGQVNMYPLASGSWGSNRAFDFNGADLGFTAGNTYAVEFGVLKIKNSDNYRVFVNVDGVEKYNETDFVPTHNPKGCPCGGSDVSKHTGIYFYLTDATHDATFVGQSPYVDTYDVLNNQDWTWKTNNGLGEMKKNWEMANNYYLDFTPTANNTTGSFIWKFTYTHAATSGAMNIYAFANGVWGNTDNATVLDYNSCGFTAGQTYDVEICVLKLNNSAEYEFSFVVNGEKKASRTIADTFSTRADNADGLYFYFTGTGVNGTCVSLIEDSLVKPAPVPPTGEYENYDVLYNVDWTFYDGANVAQGTMPSSWSDINDKFINFTPSANNTTGSFIWAFNYTAKTISGNAYIYPLASTLWGANQLIDLNNIGLEANTEYEMELGVLKIKDSANYYVYVKANGTIIKSLTYAPTHNEGVCGNVGCSATGDDYSKHTGIYFYAPNAAHAATFTQDGFVINANGVKKLVVSGATVLEALGEEGLIPADAPVGYDIIWSDNDGNVVTGATVITDNMTIALTYVYNYTIVDVNGQTLHSGMYIYGGDAAFNGEALTVDRTTFIGYLVGGQLYRDLAEAISESVANGENVVAQTITFGLLDGASIRVDGTPSIRFTATIDKSEADAATKIVNYGMLLTTKATLDEYVDFTIHGFATVDSSLYHNLNKLGGLRCVENAKYPNQYVYSLILDKVSKGNYGVEYVARAYVEVLYKDGTKGYVYGEFNREQHTRSMYDVASAAIQDTQYGYTDAQKAIIQQHIDGVIDLDNTLTLQGQPRNYEVAVNGPVDGEYTVIVTAKNGFDINAIGAIYVGGVKVPVYNASLENGTFVLKAEDMDALTLAEFNTFLADQEKQSELVINAYSGPSLGLKVNSAGQWVNAGYNFTLADLETYMAAGFGAWRLEISPYTSVLSYTAKGTTYNSDSANRDIYKALDLAAEYAAKYNATCDVYVQIPEVTGLVTTELEKIKTYYDILTNYDDGITGRNGVPSPVNGKNQIAGFLLKDEPKMSDVTNFETIFDYLHSTCGAGAAGYDYMIALLQSYAGSENIGDSFETYVNTYAEILKDAKSVGFDSYPFKYEKEAWSSNGSYSFKSEWFSLMQTYRELDNGYTTCIQSYTAGMSGSDSFLKSNSYNVIQYEAEISMQVYTALAYGYTNLDYFTYGDRLDYDTQVKTEIYQDVPVQWNDYSDWSKGYKLNSMYSWIQNTNKEAISLYDALCKFTSNGVQLIKGETSNNIFGSATTTNTTTAIEVTSTYDMVVGGFNCGEQVGYLAVNADLPTAGNRTTNASFTLDNTYTKAIVYVNGVAEVRQLTNGVLTMNIGAGEGVFIVPMK